MEKGGTCLDDAWQTAARVPIFHAARYRQAFQISETSLQLLCTVRSSRDAVDERVEHSPDVRGAVINRRGLGNNQLRDLHFILETHDEANPQVNSFRISGRTTPQYPR